MINYSSTKWCVQSQHVWCRKTCLQRERERAHGAGAIWGDFCWWRDGGREFQEKGVENDSLSLSQRLDWLDPGLGSQAGYGSGDLEG